MDIQKTVCHRCFAVLDAGDNFCRHCGTPTTAGSPDAVPVYVVPEAPPRRASWTESPWVVLFMLLVVLGPLGLPMLWRSRQFSLVWKIVLTAIVVVVTVGIIYLIWYVLHKALEPLEQLRQMQGL